MELHRTVTIVDAVDAHVGAELRVAASSRVYLLSPVSLTRHSRALPPRRVEEEALLLGCI